MAKGEKDCKDCGGNGYTIKFKGELKEHQVQCMCTIKNPNWCWTLKKTRKLTPAEEVDEALELEAEKLEEWVREKEEARQYDR